MNTDSFFSLDKYLVLPTKANPKVFLAVTNSRKAKVAFELYTPFSFKTRFLKAIAKIAFINFNFFARKIVSKKLVKSSFISFLEQQFHKDLTCSVYIATDKDKVVLQLQDASGVVGYVKYAINARGEKKLLNEKKGITILSRNNIVPKLMLEGVFEDSNYIILKKLEGNVQLFDTDEYQKILNSFKKDTSYKLSNHPRIITLKESLAKNDFKDLSKNLEKIIARSTLNYLEVYEHGDFAPWNLIQTKEGLTPFDFEYFEEKGLEYLDKIKYHFQIENLLNKKEGLVLIKALSEKIKLEEFNLIFQVFLMKEILNKFTYNESFKLETELLQFLKEKSKSTSASV
ncbi:hypothetical protein [Zobellia uliginosa]|uniref:hypothetical protein n=1 Tax=Zobellia uliginosa TaxID=143224 RepID=UPI001C0739FA|nr:hypothetical protein [Zobellia uliginosa]MBU2947826.1 hypothetical protein [Zobellia uliginosa]